MTDSAPTDETLQIAADGKTTDDRELLAPGAAIGRYVVLGSVGCGAMGVVYAAYDPDLDRKVALKLLKPQAGQGGGGQDDSIRKERLLREAKATAKLSHPNVVAMHDVGVFKDQVFLAMEFLGGGTLRRWLEAKKRAWREIVQMFIEVGRGLAAAHAAGLIHRDFKPENVLLDKEGRPRVVDFGLARLAAGEPPTADLPATQALESAQRDGESTALTRTGAVMGTPAYMGPEQFLGLVTDARTDQFSFCAALYEALYGQRPFAGDTVLSLAANVTEGHLRPLPKDSRVPVWVRRVLLSGLATEPARRFSSMEAVLKALGRDPSAVLRRRLFFGLVAVLLISTVVIARQSVVRRRQQIEKQIIALIAESSMNLEEAGRRNAQGQRQRQEAFAAFDTYASDTGEKLWRQSLDQGRAAEALCRKATQSAEAAFRLDSSEKSRDQMADVLRSRIALAEGQRHLEEMNSLVKQLASLQPDHPLLKELAQPAHLTLRVSPAHAQIVLERYELRPNDRREPVLVRTIPSAPAPFELPPGSYRLRLSANGFADTNFPFVLRRGESRTLTLDLVSAVRVPKGYVYVPEGSFLFGDADEEKRRSFLKTAPLHEVKTGAFLIGRTEVTYRSWIEFLDSVPEHERKRRMPRSTEADIADHLGSVELSRAPSGRWHLRISPASRAYSANEGESIDYIGRVAARSQRWEQMPVTGVSVNDAQIYFEWLNRTGRLRGARLCTENEWERAGRGADDRIYPHGDSLDAADANHDVTYGRKPEAFGPNEVGSFPESRSPFGVDDLAGNVWEFASSSLVRGEVVVRGGGFYFQKDDARSTNREPFEASARLVHMGLRTCADPQ